MAEKKTASKKDAEAPKEPRARKSRNFTGDEKIKILVTDSPKRKGTAAAERWDCYKNGMTVNEYVAAGGRFSSVTWDWRRGFISLDNKPHPDPIKPKAPAKPKAEKAEKKAAA